MLPAAPSPNQQPIARRPAGSGDDDGRHRTAARFREAVRSHDYEEAALGSRLSGMDVALSVELRLPTEFGVGLRERESWSCHDLDEATRLMRAVIEEIRLRSAFFGPTRVVDVLRIEGGMPSLLPLARIIDCVEALDSHFNLSDDPWRDYLVEADTRFTSEGRLRLWAALGFNHLRIANEDTRESVRRLLDLARALGFQCISMEIDARGPARSRASLAATLAEAAVMGPDRLYVRGCATHGLESLTVTKETLGSAGYEHIGLGQFVLPGDVLARSKINGALQWGPHGYCTHLPGDVAQFGLGAIGNIGGYHVKNWSGAREHSEAVAAASLPHAGSLQLRFDDRVRAELLRQLLCSGCIDIHAIEVRFGMEFDAYFADELAHLRRLAADGLVEFARGRILITADGQWFARSVLAVFDHDIEDGRFNPPRPRGSSACPT